MKKICLLSAVLSMVLLTSSVTLDKRTAIVVGNNVRLRSLPHTKGSILATKDTGAPMIILDKTEKPEQLIKSREFHYHWYKVQYAANKTGWIYGQFLYILNTAGMGYNGEVFTFKGKKYRLLVFDEPEISYDMPDDDSYTIPILLDISAGKYHPLYMEDSLYDKLSYRGQAKEYPFFMFIGNTGFGDGVEEDPVVQDNLLSLKVNVGFQDGGAEYKMIIKLNSDKTRFTITDIMEYRSDY